VTRIRFAHSITPDGDQSNRAEGVEFVVEGQTHFAGCNREVILCAGALKTPQILELSGIGSPDHLTTLGIDLKIDLPGVGENAQEHSYFGMSFELDSTLEYDTWDKLFDPTRAAAEMVLLNEKQQGLFTMGLAGVTFVPLQKTMTDPEPLISAQRSKLERNYKEGMISEGLWEQYQMQLKRLENPNSVDVEYTGVPVFFTPISKPEAGKAYTTVFSVLKHLFSRGSVHAASKDPLQKQIMDPHYFEDDFDLQVLVESLKFVRVLRNTEPWKSVVAKEVDPGPSVQTDEEMRAYIRHSLETISHTCGTCSMLPREKGGVVDPKLKMYGTKNVRVVDLSIVPLHVAAHPQGMVYGIAEQAADIIKQDHAK